MVYCKNYWWHQKHTAALMRINVSRTIAATVRCIAVLYNGRFLVAIFTAYYGLKSAKSTQITQYTWGTKLAWLSETNGIQKTYIFAWSWHLPDRSYRYFMVLPSFVWMESPGSSTRSAASRTAAGGPARGCPPAPTWGLVEHSELPR